MALVRSLIGAVSVSLAGEPLRLPVDQITPRHHWKIRGLAGYALPLIPDLKQLLEEEGAVKPEEPDVIRVTFPELPTIPDPSFQWRLAGSGEDDGSSAAT